MRWRSMPSGGGDDREKFSNIKSEIEKFSGIGFCIYMIETEEEDERANTWQSAEYHSNPAEVSIYISKEIWAEFSD